MKSHKFLPMILVSVALLSGCASEAMDATIGLRRTSQASRKFVVNATTPNPTPSGVGIPGTPHATPTPRPPLPLLITREEALREAERRTTHYGTLQLDLVAQCTLGEAGQYGAGGLAPGDRFNDDPVWVVRYKGTFYDSGHRFSYLTLMLDGNTGESLCTGLFEPVAHEP